MSEWTYRCQPYVAIRVHHLPPPMMTLGADVQHHHDGIRYVKEERDAY